MVSSRQHAPDFPKYRYREAAIQAVVVFLHANLAVGLHKARGTSWCALITKTLLSGLLVSDSPPVYSTSARRPYRRSSRPLSRRPYEPDQSSPGARSHSSSDQTRTMRGRG